MGAELTSESGERIRMTGSAWDFYVWLAQDYGWEAAGTLPPAGTQGPEWDGSYSLQVGQRVTKEDAAAMAKALERALLDPERLRRQRVVVRRLDDHVNAMALDLYGIRLKPVQNEEIASDDDLRKLASFLRAGGVTIE